MDELASLSDEELIEKYRAGDSNALDLILSRNKALVSSLARPYFLIGGSTEDLIQEGTIGLLKAIFSFDKEKNDKFHPYAKTCVKRAILDALKIANRDKHRALNDSIPLQVLTEESGPYVSPEEEFLHEEKKLIIKERIYKPLSGPQKKLLGYFLEGYSYDEIASLMNKDIKYVDNALQIIKRKIRKSLDEEE